MKMKSFNFFMFFCLPLVIFRSSAALPLSTSGRWIVDEAGRRVKLGCVNWPSHIDVMLAEGLNKQHLDAISEKIGSLGFNCVRLTWATYMVTNGTYSNLTVRQSLMLHGLSESVAAITVLNPGVIDLTLLDALKTVVESLRKSNIMVILDNHVSKPMWCCGREDGNGFFGDEYFDPDQWLLGLSKIASEFNGATNVIAMSLRNELRGPRQNVPDWYKYMQRGAEAVHSRNPHVLVILSGLSFDNDLSFLSTKPVDLTFKNKLVYELHWYSFSNPGEWLAGGPNDACARITGGVMKKAGFLLGSGFPLFMSEFGVDQRGANAEDNRYMACVLAMAAELDVDWALWTLQGSYYTREGKMGTDEAYSVLDYDWVKVKNESFMRVISSIQPPFGGPGLAETPPYDIIYHPTTGQCLLRNSFNGPIQLGPCEESEPWAYNQQELQIKGPTTSCLQAHGAGEPTKIGTVCGGPNSKWAKISPTKMQFQSALGPKNTALCLDLGPDGKTLVTNPCSCLSGGPQCEPEAQWFKLVASTRRTTREILH